MGTTLLQHTSMDEMEAIICSPVIINAVHTWGMLRWWPCIQTESPPNRPCGGGIEQFTVKIYQFFSNRFYSLIFISLLFTLHVSLGVAEYKGLMLLIYS